MIPHIQRHPRAFFPLPRRVRAMAVASCERCYRPLTGCITKLCKAPTCAINIFKNPPARLLGWYVRIYGTRVFIQVVEARIGFARAISSLSFISAEGYAGEKALKTCRGAVRWSRDHLRYRTANRHLLDTHSTGDEADVCSLSFPYRRPYAYIMKSLVSFVASKARKNDKR